MAAPPKLRALRMEDFAPDLPAEQVPAFQKTFEALNPFLTQTSTALDRKLTVKDNHAAVYKTVTVTAPDWVPVGTTSSTTVPYFSAANNWTNYASSPFDAPVRYWVDDVGHVWWDGLAARSSGAGVAGEVMITIPAAITPAKGRTFGTNTNSGYGEVYVRADGTITWQSGGVTRVGFQNVHYPLPVAPGFVGAGWPIVLKPVDEQGRSMGAVPEDVQVSRVVDTAAQNNTAHVAGGLDWAPDGKGGVVIKRVGGLAPGRTYQITFLLSV